MYLHEEYLLNRNIRNLETSLEKLDEMGGGSKYRKYVPSTENISDTIKSIIGKIKDFFINIYKRIKNWFSNLFKAKETKSILNKTKLVIEAKTLEKQDIGEIVKDFVETKEKSKEENIQEQKTEEIKEEKDPVKRLNILIENAKHYRLVFNHRTGKLLRTKELLDIINKDVIPEIEEIIGRKDEDHIRFSTSDEKYHFEIFEDFLFDYFPRKKYNRDFYIEEDDLLKIANGIDYEIREVENWYHSVFNKYKRILDTAIKNDDLKGAPIEILKAGIKIFSLPRLLVSQHLQLLSLIGRKGSSKEYVGEKRRLNRRDFFTLLTEKKKKGVDLHGGGPGNLNIGFLPNTTVISNDTKELLKFHKFKDITKDAEYGDEKGLLVKYFYKTWVYIDDNVTYLKQSLVDTLKSMEYIPKDSNALFAIENLGVDKQEKIKMTFRSGISPDDSKFLVSVEEVSE